MKRILFSIAAAWFVVAAARTDDGAAPPFEKEIQAFEAADRAHAPPQDGVLFVGSSSIRFWESLNEDFPGVPTLNRGFGGSTIADCTRYAERIVAPYHPRRIVFYAGDNDVAAGLAPERILADFMEFVDKVRARLPEEPILFISIKPSQERWRLADRIRETNRLIRAYAAANKVEYVDVFTPMLGRDGRPRRELFRADGLHMKPAGYALWAALVDPFVRADRPAVFPNESGENLGKHPVVLPGDFEGKRNLVFVAFRHDQQPIIASWTRHDAEFEAAAPGLGVYELPTIKKMGRMIRWMITSGMSGGIPDAATREHTIPLFIDKAPFERALKIDDEGTIYALVLNRAGEVLWRASGPYDDAKGNRLLDFLRTTGRSDASATPSQR
jgi:lysophospholipase L1-like esterase